MRLIDADAFKEYIRGACKEMSHVYKDGGKWAKQITDDFCMDIDEQPTIEERKKGKWRRRLVDCGFNADWHCSRCGWKTSLEEHGYNFCPNCGADMRGEKHETD